MRLSVSPALTAAALLLGLVIAAPQATAQEAAPPCAAIADANERLACYDRAFPPITGAGTVASQAQLEASRKLAEEEFGLNPRQLFDRKPAALQQIAPDRLQDRVKSIVERADGQRAVTLENGQVWLLTEVTSRGRLAPGDTITLREAALGTYMLLTPKRVPLRAKRLR
jgi:hypothetical protein